MPAMFHVNPATEPSDNLPIGAEFECVYAPEKTTEDGWVIVRFKVGMYPDIRRADRLIKGYAQVSKTAISESEAEALWNARA